MGVRQTNVVATKMASGDVLVQLQSPTGSVFYTISIPAADFTAFNTTVNGGSTGATVTKTYAQDATLADYPQGLGQSM